jgi:hypothetical protein
MMKITSAAIERVAKAIAPMIPCEDGGQWNPGFGLNFPQEYTSKEIKNIRRIARVAVKATVRPKP